MVLSHPKVNELSGGWYVLYEDGEVRTEEETTWINLPNKKNIILMGIKRHNKYYEISGKKNYLAPGETHMREIAVNSATGLTITKQTLIGWFIGYCDTEGKTYLRVCAESGKVVKETIPYDNPRSAQT